MKGNTILKFPILTKKNVKFGSIFKKFDQIENILLRSNHLKEPRKIDGARFFKNLHIKNFNFFFNPL